MSESTEAMSTASFEEVEEVEEVEEKKCVYVQGTLRHDNHPALAVLSPRAFGWKCRSMYSDSLRHDYVKKESLSDVEDFLAYDLKKGFAFIFSREEALEHLSTLLGASNVQRHPHAVVGPPCAPALDAAEGVLRHLELGY